VYVSNKNDADNNDENFVPVLSDFDRK